MSDRNGLQPGIKGTSQTSVGPGNTALFMGSGEIEVFATPAMAALMEAAAVACVKPYLPANETSVGINIATSHIAATPPGMKVRAEATLESVEGRRLLFRVEAYDDVEKIGEGRHERVVVDRDKFLGKVNRKSGGTP